MGGGGTMTSFHPCKPTPPPTPNHKISRLEAECRMSGHLESVWEGICIDLSAVLSLFFNHFMVTFDCKTNGNTVGLIKFM